MSISLPRHTWPFMICVFVYVYTQLLSHAQFFVTPWTVACQATLSVRFPRQEYWSRLPFLAPGIFLTQGSNPCLLGLPHWQVNLLPLNHLGSTLRWPGLCQLFHHLLHPCTSSFRLTDFLPVPQTFQVFTTSSLGSFLEKASLYSKEKKLERCYQHPEEQKSEQDNLFHLKIDKHFKRLRISRG